MAISISGLEAGIARAMSAWDTYLAHRVQECLGQGFTDDGEPPLIKPALQRGRIESIASVLLPLRRFFLDTPVHRILCLYALELLQRLHTPRLRRWDDDGMLMDEEAPLDELSPAVDEMRHNYDDYEHIDCNILYLRYDEQTYAAVIGWRAHELLKWAAFVPGLDSFHAPNDCDSLGRCPSDEVLQNHCIFFIESAGELVWHSNIQ